MRAVAVVSAGERDDFPADQLGGALRALSDETRRRRGAAARGHDVYGSRPQRFLVELGVDDRGAAVHEQADQIGAAVRVALTALGDERSGPESRTS